MGEADPNLEMIGEGLYKPDYRLNIVTLANSVLAALGYRPHGSKLPPDLHQALEGGERIVLAVLDGLGASIIESSIPFMKLRELGFYTRISSVFPSTTSSALASLATGLEPASHGLLGFTMLCRKAGGLIKLLRLPQSLSWRGMEPDILSPLDIMGERTIYETMAREGEPPLLLTRRHLTDSLLTRTLYSGSEVLGYAEPEDGLIALDRALQGNHRLITFYSEIFDVVGHIYGPSSLEASLQADRLLSLFTKLEGHGNSRLIVTADHGMIWIGGRQYQLAEDEEVLEHLELPPYGDMRATMLKSSSEGLLDLLEDRGAGSWFTVLEKRSVVEKGLLGSSDLGKYSELRLGDYVLVPGPGSAFDLKLRRRGKSHKLLGGHSGLDPEELLVPLLIIDI